MGDRWDAQRHQHRWERDHPPWAAGHNWCSRCGWSQRWQGRALYGPAGMDGWWQERNPTCIMAPPGPTSPTPLVCAGRGWHRPRLERPGESVCRDCGKRAPGELSHGA